MKRIFHIIPNAHLDPVWLWDWREGLNEGVATSRAILNLMDEFPEMTFMRGEAVIYDFTRKTDPATFERIRKMVEAGRWDIVGGNYLQGDTNIPDTATFIRQYQTGQEYFRSNFGRTCTAAWAADSFGHSAGLPDIYHHAGFRYFAFCRPAENILHLDKPLFRWKGAGGGEILSWRSHIGWYGTERTEVPRRMDEALNSPDYGIVNHAVFIGLGNHGGGPSRRHIEDLLAWRDAHPEVEVRFSTLHGFFKEAEKEIAANGDGFIPTFEGELNFCMRGCHTSAAVIKHRFRRAEAALKRAEAVAHYTAPLSGYAPEPLTEEWNGLLFNTFHDILPGTSIRRACIEQAEWLDGIAHRARSAEFTALNAFAARLDIGVPKPARDFPQAVPRLIFNPRPYDWTGPVEVEAAMDYRPSFDYQDDPDRFPFEVRDEADRPLPFQRIATEMEGMEVLAWRRRVVVDLTVPAGGWRVVKLAHVPAPELAAFAGAPVEAGPEAIANEFYRVSARRGDYSMKITRADGTPFLAAEGIEFATYFDPEGAWGSMCEDPVGFSCPKHIESWRIEEVKLLEAGPIRAKLFVHFKGANSNIALLVSVASGRDAVDIDANLLWQDRALRLRMVADPVASATYAIPGGAITRKVIGDVPGGRWVTVRQGDAGAAIATDVVTGFTALKDAFCLNLVRGCRATSDCPSNGAFRAERPIIDQGEHRIRMALSATPELAERLAAELELPFAEMMSWPHQGELPMQGSTLKVAPESVRLLQIAQADGGFRLVLQAPADTEAEFFYGGRKVGETHLAAWVLTDAEVSI